MFLGCHIALNVCLTFASKYNNTKQGMDLYVAIGGGVFCAGANIFSFAYVSSIPALIIGGAIGFCTGGLHFYINKRNKELEKKISQNKSTNNSGLDVMSDLLSQMAQAQKTAEKLERITRNPTNTEVFSKTEIVGGLVNWQDVQSKLTSFEQMYIRKILDKFKTDTTQRRLTHKQYLDLCNEMISHFDMVAPHYKYCGDSTMEFLATMLDDDKKVYRGKAKKLLESGLLFSAEWNALNREFKKEFYDEDTEEFVDTFHSGTNDLFDENEEFDEEDDDDEIDNDSDEFSVSEDDAEIIATFFRQGVTDVDTILKKLNWNEKKRKQFIDFLLLMDFIDFGSFDDLDKKLRTNDTSLSIDGHKLQEFFDNLPIEFGEDFFDQEWHDDCCKTLKELIEEMATKNPTFKSKNKYTLDDVDMLIGMSFCCITRKPKDLCKTVQETIKEFTNKKELSLSEIITLVDKVFASFADDEFDDDDVDE